MDVLFEPTHFRGTFCICEYITKGLIGDGIGPQLEWI